jgi:two-component system chemotaxis sensor kinase CheA
MDELLAQFMTEASELLLSASDDLLALERAPEDAARIDSVFRAVHTLKGSVGLFDFAPLGAVLHAAEDLLGAVRDGALTADGVIFDTLLECVGTVEDWIGAIGRTGALPGDAFDTARRISDELRARLENSSLPAASGLPTDSEWLAAIVRRGAEFAAHADAAWAWEGLTALRYRPDPDCFFRGDDPVAIVRSIPELRMVHIAPRDPWKLDEFEPFRCNLVIEVLSAAPRDDIDRAIRFVRDQIDIASAEMAGEKLPGRATLQGSAGAAQTARTLRIDASRVDALADVVGELIVAKNGLAHLATEAARVSPEFARALSAQQATIARLAGEMQRGVTGLRTVKLAQTFRRLPRVVRETAARVGKQVRLEVHGSEIDADKTVVDALYEPLLHVLRNAVDHGIESAQGRVEAGKPAIGVVSLQAVRQGDEIVVTVTDDGAGIDPANVRQTAFRRGVMPAEQVHAMDDAASLDLVFAPGFSTAASVTETSGRGVGLDAVRRAMEALGGRAGMSSEPGRGSRLRLAVPLAVSVTTVIIVRAGSERYGVPLDMIVETARIPRTHILPVGRGLAFVLRDRTIPFVQLADLLDCPVNGHDAEEARVLIMADGNQRIGLGVDSFGERMDTVLRPLQGLLSSLRGTQGTALLGDGSVLLVLNVLDLIAQVA